VVVEENEYSVSLISRNNNFEEGKREHTELLNSFHFAETLKLR